MPCNHSRVLIADDHCLVAELCKNLLEAEFDVVGVVTNGHDLVQAANKLKPDAIVVDIAMPVLNGMDAGKQVKQNLHEVKLLYLTMNTDPELALEAFHRGASGYLLKTCAASDSEPSLGYAARIGIRIFFACSTKGSPQIFNVSSKPATYKCNTVTTTS